jgi:drug/metabolite transporter (DMT)-like permease
VSQRPDLGIALIVLMAACFAGMDTIIKYAGKVVPVLLMLWMRYAFQAAVMAVWLARSKTAGFRAAHPSFQWIRGTLLLVTSAMSFFGLQHMPVAEFTAIFMLTPVLVTLLAAWLLRERVSALRWALVFGGFAGALAIVRPGSGLFGWAVLFPLTGALCYASFQVLTSKLSATRPTSTPAPSARCWSRRCCWPLWPWTRSTSPPCCTPRALGCSRWCSRSGCSAPSATCC